ncbi:hypothetical protein AMTRI_Chr02g222950 [Amborella trichopoda]
MNHALVRFPQSSAMVWARPTVLFVPSNLNLKRAHGLVASLALSSSKCRRRKNKLRPKLLRTLPKPALLDTQQQKFSDFVIEPDRFDHNTISEELCMAPLPLEEENLEVEIHGFNQAEVISHGFPDSFSSRSVIHLVLSLVGVFVVQTACAVWVLGSANFDDKLGKLEENGDGSSSSSSPNIENGLFSSGRKDGYFAKLSTGEAELGERISLIRSMAREARANERKRLKEEDPFVSLEENDTFVETTKNLSAPVKFQTPIEKEVDKHLEILPRLVPKRLKDSTELPVKSVTKVLDVQNLIGKSRSRKASRKNSPYKYRQNLDGIVKEADKNRSKSVQARAPWGSRGSSSDKNGEGSKRKATSADVDGRNGNSHSVLGREKHNMEDEIGFSKVLDGKLERKDEGTKERIQPRIEAIDLQTADTKGTNQSSPTELQENMGSYKTRESSAHHGETEKIINFVNEINQIKLPLPLSSSPLKSDVSDHEIVERLESGKEASTSDQVDVADNWEKDVTNDFPVGEINHLGGSHVSTESGKGMKNSYRSFKTEYKEESNTSTVTGDSVHYVDQVSQNMLRELKDNELGNEKDQWWKNLRYVLAIFLYRGADGSKGLYSLKMGHSPIGEGSSHSIMFEDRGDANNFCYLLESFFKDLGDAQAKAVPLTINELDEAVQSGRMNVKVVRKGQLRLYAGQALEEVEKTLRSL